MTLDGSLPATKVSENLNFQCSQQKIEPDSGATHRDMLPTTPTLLSQYFLSLYRKNTKP